MSEFDIIRQYFTDLTVGQGSVILGIGDDCALLTPDSGKQLATSMDTLVSGRHFLPDVDPVSLGHKSLAVNLSDLAAMGATPAWVMLSLTLPSIDHIWLEGFCEGFAALAKVYDVQLVGGDTTRGPLSITVQVSGFVDQGKALMRSGARAGDKIFVSGTVGDAGLGLKIQSGEYQAEDTLQAVQCLQRPEPRIELGRALQGVASAAIDISDGLAADLGHICEQSQVGANLYFDKVPVSPALKTYMHNQNDRSLPLSAGDDYELCFTVPQENIHLLASLSLATDLPLTEIGEMVATHTDVEILDLAGKPIQPLTTEGYDHFS